jgi:hypothetical protein
MYGLWYLFSPSVLWIRNYFLFWSGSGFHFSLEFWIRILLGLQKVPDPTLIIHNANDFKIFMAYNAGYSIKFFRLMYL